jgi:hypothetical protein
MLPRYRLPVKILQRRQGCAHWQGKFRQSHQLHPREHWRKHQPGGDGPDCRSVAEPFCVVVYQCDRPHPSPVCSAGKDLQRKAPPEE